MDLISKNLLQEALNLLKPNLTSINHLLDYIYSCKLIDQIELQQLTALKTEKAFKQVSQKLIDDLHGYKVLLGYLDKDYNWLYKEFAKQETVENMQKLLEERAISLGDIPNLPKFYVKRSALMEANKRILLETAGKRSKLSFHGMQGIGKTVTISAILRDPQVLKAFNYKIYWIEAQDVETDMKLLLKKICLNDESFADLRDREPKDIDETVLYMKCVFTSADYNKALVVLNRCKDREYADRFALTSCSLLTISQLAIYPDSHLIYLNFNREDCIRLFSLALDCNYSWLLTEKGQATYICEYCKGYPKFIREVAEKMCKTRASLKNGDEEVWNEFRDYVAKLLSDLEGNLGLFKNMPEELLERSRDLVLFQTDVNIPSPVLETLWGLKSFEVQDVMIDMERYAVVKSEYDERRKWNIYGVHDEHLRLLKAKMDDEQLMALHRKLVDAYMDRYKSVHHFPDDNYIFQYIGYHLSQAHYERFDYYFDLKFLNAKIRTAGHHDLLKDYQIYKSHIIRDDADLEKKWKDFYQFLQKWGSSLYRYPCTSIVQVALNTPEDSAVHKAALRELDDTRLYFRWLSAQSNQVQSVNLTDELTAACFTRIKNNFIVGTKSGKIELWDQHHEYMLDTFNGHSAQIIFLEVKGIVFLSLSSDGVVCVWPFEESNSRRESFQLRAYDDVVPMPSPRTKQSEHQVFFGNDFTNEYRTRIEEEKDRITAASFCNSHDEHCCDRIVTGSKAGTLTVWDTSRKSNASNVTKVFTKKLLDCITCVLFSSDDSLIFVATDKRLSVFDEDGEFIFMNAFESDLLTLHIMDKMDSIDQQLIVVGVNFITQFNIKYMKNCTSSANKVQTILEEDKCPARIICSSFTEPYLIVGFEDNRINMWDTEKGQLIQTLLITNGKFICIDTVTNINDKTIQLLLTGFDNKTLQLWHIIPNVSSLENVQICEASLIDSEAYVVSVVASEDEEKSVIKVSQNFNVTSERYVDRKVVYLSTCNGKIYYATDRNEIYMYDLEALTPIATFTDDIIYFKVIAEALVVLTHSEFFVRCNDRNEKIENVCVCGVPIDCFPFAKVGYLLVTTNSIIKCTFSPPTFSALLDDKEFKTVAFSDVGGKLCVCKSEEFLIFQVTAADYSKVKCCRLEESVCSAVFSSDAKYLAFGCNSGNILIWDAKELFFIKKLELHKNPVRCLRFGPGLPILVSLSEQIAWWNVSLVKPSNSFRSRSNSARNSRTLRLKNLKISDEASEAECLKSDQYVPWSQLLAHDGSKSGALLQSIKLSDNHAQSLVHSEHFDMFLVTYRSGEVFALKRKTAKECTIDRL